MKSFNISLIVILFVALGQTVNAQSDCTEKYFQARDFYQKGILYKVPDLLENLGDCDDPMIELEANLFLAQTYYNLQQFQRADRILMKLHRKRASIAYKDYDLQPEFEQYCSKFYTLQKRFYVMLGESRFKYVHSRRYSDSNGDLLANIKLQENGSYKSLDLGLSLGIPSTDIMINPAFGFDMTPFSYEGQYYFNSNEGNSEVYETLLDGEYLTGRFGLFVRFNDLKEKFVSKRAMLNFMKGFYAGGQTYITLQSNNQLIKDATAEALPSEVNDINGLLQDNSLNYNRKDIYYCATLGYNYNIPLNKHNMLIALDARYDIIFNSFKDPSTMMNSSGYEVTSTLSYPNPERVLLLHLGVGVQWLSYKPKVKKLK